MEKEFIVEAGSFAGPLDLMLHLIRQHKMELENLNLSDLADQYIAYLQHMQQLHLEIASEYLVELATLVEYKSRILLPRPELEEEDTYEEDQRQNLVARLLEYQAYKEAGMDLAGLYEARSRHFTREPSGLVGDWQRETPMPAADQDLSKLYKAMQRVLRRHAILQPCQTKLKTRELSTEQRRRQLEKVFETTARCSFSWLCNDCTSRHMVIVTFLAVLDLVHDNWLDAAVQEEEIILTKGKAYGQDPAGA